MKIDTTGITPMRDAQGRTRGFEVRVQIGSRASGHKDRCFFPADASYLTMQEWRRLARLRLQHGAPRTGTLAADVVTYLANAPLTKTTKRRRSQQLAFWCAQPAAIDAPVLTVKQVTTEAAAVTAGARPVDRGSTLGDRPRALLEAKRLRQILDRAFAPTNSEADPTEFAGTANHYRTALYHLHSVLDQDDDGAVNPLDKVATRALPGAQLIGQDMRVIREILAHLPTKYGREGEVSIKRAEVLAWCPITPVQLMRLNPEADFRDVPDASREDQIAGAITVRVPPRFKGQRKRIATPTIEPLTPYGVMALRAFTATPKAWGTFSLPSLNKAFKRAARQAQAALAAQGVRIDLAGVTIYQLKHSLAATMAIASGLVDPSGTLKTSEGVRRMLGHADAQTTRVYTLGAVDPLKRLVSEQTARYLDTLLATPLRPAPRAGRPALRRVK